MAPVLVERPAEGVALLRLHRPEARNALNNAVRAALAEHFRAFGEDSTTRCIVLTGDERAFAAGADLKEVAALGAREMMQTGVRRLWKAIAECPKPVKLLFDTEDQKEGMRAFAEKRKPIFQGR